MWCEKLFELNIIFLFNINIFNQVLVYKIQTLTNINYIYINNIITQLSQSQ